MALTRSVGELITETMRDLGLLSQRQDPSEDDAAFIRKRYEDVLEELRDEDLVYWQDDAIPKEAFLAMVKYLGLEVGGAFGLPGFNVVDLNTAQIAAKKRIRRRVSKPTSGEPVTVEDF